MADDIPFGSFAPAGQPSPAFDLSAFIQRNPQLRDAILSMMMGPAMSDEAGYPIAAGQQYAMDVGKRNRSILSDVPAGKGRGEGGGGRMTAQEREMEKALEQIRKENAGKTREQRREEMRKAGQEEFERGANMTDAEWDAQFGDALRASRRK